MFNDLEKTVDKFMTACDEATENLRRHRELKLVMQNRKATNLKVRIKKLRMTNQASEELSNSTTPVAIYQWLQTWESVPPGHAQYDIKEEQIAIGKMALKEGENNE
jgi:hypothetical protein